MNKKKTILILTICILVLVYILFNNNNEGFKNEDEKPNIAIYFSGRIKAYENNIDNLLAIKKKYNPVFFLSLNDDNSEYIEQFCNLLDITDNQKNMEKLSEPIFLHKYYKPDDIIYYSTYSQYYNNKKAFKLIEKYSVSNNITFDIVVKYRADILANSVIELEIPQANTVYIPDCCDYPDGYNDQVAYGDMDTMKIYSSLVDSIEYMCTHGTPFHPEFLLYTYLTNSKVLLNRFNYDYSLDNNRYKEGDDRYEALIAVKDTIK